MALDIWLALKGRIKTLSTSATIVWPTDKFVAPMGAYIKVAFINAAPRRVAVNDSFAHDHSGFLLLTFVAPLLKGLELGGYLSEAETIAAHFKDGVHMSYNGVCVRVSASPHIMDGFEQDGYWNIVVRIPWRA